MPEVNDAIYYDPWNFEIDTDPYPLWRRMREEAPLYWNDQHEFFAVSRYEDVERCLVNWKTYISGKGSVLDAIKLDIPIMPGNILMEDPPEHDMHRALMSRVFTPKRMEGIADEVRTFCGECLDPLVGTGGFDFVRDLGAYMPMRVIGMLLGIPTEHQQEIREIMDEAMELEDGDGPVTNFEFGFKVLSGEIFADYVNWREDHPSDDLMTDLLNVEFEDETGTTRGLRRDEILGYVGLVASAGNETSTRLISWTGKLLAEHPEQRAAIVADPALVRPAIEEILRFEAPSPVQARYVTEDVEVHGTTVKEGQIMVLLNGAANRDDRKFENGDTFDIHRKIEQHLSFGYGLHFCLGASLARLEGRIALEEVLRRFPEWDIDWENAKQAHTSTVRGWVRMPVFTN